MQWRVVYMTRHTYEQVHADFRYLMDTYTQAADMTGGYVDGDEWDEILDSPTKATAKSIMIRRIQYWLYIGPDNYRAGADPVPWHDPEVVAIAKRYGADVPSDFDDD